MSAETKQQEEVSSSTVVLKVKAMEQRASQRKAARSAPTEKESSAPLPARKASKNGTPSPNLVRHAELRLIEQEQLGLFTAFPIRPGNEFPSLLARLPLFPAIARSRQRSLLDKDNALPFSTPFGQGRRHGPPVSVEDEDYLIALMRLRQKKLIGQGPRLPIPIGFQQPFSDHDGNVGVHVVCCTVTQIIGEMGNADNGQAYQRTLASLKRLAAMVVEIETSKSERYLGTVKNGTSIKLVDIVWQAFEQEGLIIAQFNPVVAKWLEHDATYLDWETRRQLVGRNARALHRFLSSQPKTYESTLERIAETIGWEGEKRRMRTGFETILSQMRDIGWVRDWEITGTGRSVPFRLKLLRS